MTTTQHIAILTARTPNLTEVEYAGSTTQLCLDLNLAMELDLAAQARYEAIWGCKWEPLPMPGLELADGSIPGGNSTAESTTLPTVR